MSSLRLFSRSHRVTCAAITAVMAGALLVGTQVQGAERSMGEKTTVNAFSGALLTTVPVSVPPYRGLEPKLSLQYSSQGAVDALGVGWSLKGFSAIERASDGRGVPNYDANDIFMLDGNELIPDCTTFGGTHCTRIESYQRIERDGTNNAWYVTAKDGTKTTYTPIATTAGGTYRWGITEQADTMGHVTTYNYWCNGSFCYPSSVTYNSSVITIYWESRPDVITYAVGTELVTLAHRIKTIDVTVLGSRLRTYGLTYVTSPNTQRSWLQNVTQYGRDAVVDGSGNITSGSSMPPVVFERQAGTSGFGTSWSKTGWASTSGWSNEYHYATIKFTDVTGDGRADVCYRDGNGIGCQPGTGTGFGAEFRGPALSNAAGWTAAGYYKTISYPDLNGDGKSDICYRNSAGIYCHLGTGSGFGAAIAGPAWSDAAGYNVAQYYSTIRYPDLNGDGKADICVRDSTGLNCYFGTGTGSFTGSFRGPVWSTAAGCGREEYYASFSFPDINGDGKADFCGRDSGGIMCWPSTGTGFGTMYRGPAWITDQTPGGTDFEYAKYYNTIRFPDLNGDGKSDVCARDSAGITCYLGTGRGFVNNFRGPAWSDAAGWGVADKYGTITLVDLNGDGRADLCGRASTGMICQFGTGSSFINQFNGPAWSDAGGWTAAQYYSTIQFADFDGNGKNDIAARNSVAITAQNMNTSPGPGDIMASLENGIGGVATVSYQPSTYWTNTLLPQGTIFQTVSSVSTDEDGGGPKPAQAVNYRYEGAYFLAAEREFLGFRKATTTLGATGAYSETYYWQRVGTIAKPEAIYKKTAAGAIMSFDKFAFTENAVPPYTSLMTEMWAHECNGDAVVDANHNYVSGCRRAYTSYEWDTYANLVRENQYGDYDVSGDERTAYRGFPVNPTKYLVGYPGFEETYRGLSTAPGDLIGSSRFYYDGHGDHATPADNGLLTKKGVWNSQTGLYVSHTYGYDSHGNMTSLTDPLGHTSYKSYDTTLHLYVTGTQNAMGHSAIIGYDLVLGAVTTQTDPNGNETTHEFDIFGRPTSSTGPDGSQTVLEYFNWGSPTLQRVRTSRSLPGGLWTSEDGYFDGLGRPYLSVDQSGVTQETEYGAAGQVSRKSLPYVSGDTIRWDTYTYDDLGRQVAVTYASGLTIAKTYDDGSMTVTDSLGNSKTTFYNIFGSPTTVRETIGGQTKDTVFAYDRLGRRTLSIDAAGNQTTASYDSLGRVLQKSDPDQGLWTYAHDLLGRVTKETDALGHSTYVSYDALGRASRRQYHDGSADTFVFDEVGFGASKGRLTTATSAGGVVTRQYYDNMGRRTKYVSTVGGDAKTITHQFDVAGRVMNVTYPDGEVVTFGYGTTVGLQYGRLKTVSGTAAGTLVSNITYTSKGQPATVTYGNGITTSYGFDSTGERVTDITVGSLASLTYGYDANGQVTSLTSPQLLNWSFLHDELGRLTKATNTDGGHSRTYTYDAIGRMMSNSAVGSYTYDAVNHVHAVTTAGANSYSYDANGNMLSGAGRAITYDYAHRPSQIDYNGLVNLFTYDALGVRVAKANGTMAGPNFKVVGDSRYVGSIYEQARASWKDPYTVTKYYFAGALRVAKRTNDTNHFLHQDHLGSTRLVTDQSALEVKRYEYDPYGKVVEQSGAADVSFRFTGQEADDETGLLFYGARYYDPALGRFIQPDSFVPDANNPQGLDLYAYAFNSPINYVDPTGHAPVVAAVVAFVCAAATYVAAWVVSNAIWIAVLVVGTALTFTNNPFLQTVGMIMCGIASVGMGGPILGLSLEQSMVLAGAVALAQSPISPLDPTVKKAIGWVYTAVCFVDAVKDLSKYNSANPAIAAEGGKPMFMPEKLAKWAGQSTIKGILALGATEVLTTAAGWALAYATSGWGTGARFAAAFIGRAAIMGTSSEAGPLAFIGTSYDLWYTLKYPDGQIIDLTGGAGGEAFTFYYHTGYESWIAFGRQHVRVGDPRGGYWEMGDTRAGWFGPGLGWGGWISTQKVTVIMTPAQAAAFRGALEVGANSGGRYEGYHKDSYVYVDAALQYATGTSLSDLHINPGLIHW